MRSRFPGTSSQEFPHLPAPKGATVRLTQRPPEPGVEDEVTMAGCTAFLILPGARRAEWDDAHVLRDHEVIYGAGPGMVRVVRVFVLGVSAEHWGRRGSGMRVLFAGGQVRLARGDRVVAGEPAGEPGGWSIAG